MSGERTKSDLRVIRDLDALPVHSAPLAGLVARLGARVARHAQRGKVGSLIAIPAVILGPSGVAHLLWVTRSSITAMTAAWPRETAGRSPEADSRQLDRPEKAQAIRQQYPALPHHRPPADHVPRFIATVFPGSLIQETSSIHEPGQAGHVAPGLSMTRRAGL
jgi:hypothetical protein